MPDDVTTTQQLVLEIKRCKLSRSACLHSSRNIKANLEGCYIEGKRKKLFKTPDQKVHNGTIYCLPWKETLNTLRIFFSAHVETTRIETGISFLDVKKVNCHQGAVELTLDIMKGTMKVGKALCQVGRQSLFANDDGILGVLPQKATSFQDEINLQEPLPKFQFRRLSKPLNWDRLRALDLNRLVHRSDR